jgi:hypothetical protein
MKLPQRTGEITRGCPGDHGQKEKDKQRGEGSIHALDSIISGRKGAKGSRKSRSLGPKGGLVMRSKQGEQYVRSSARQSTEMIREEKPTGNLR